MSKAAKGKVSKTTGGTVIKTVEGEMNKKAGINRTKIDITTPEALAIIVKAMTNWDPISESW